ncbi:MFS general substrate transporter [Microthyrium microscopicum]|uniref:MFS general substrate transporter n=1 Tax=Microthyrium microscopicum TaxID=703497 RepID=A0A6A6U5G3_9PEZI|nr:MFS general substrate transporter [Microthyrium microscopicum]
MEDPTDTLEPRDDQPLLLAPDADTWTPPRSFFWIEAAIMANVFLYGFDTTITASTYAVISSDFDAANMASWLTTSYLVTSTAFQPLYGRFSDIFGRRICFFVSTVTFSLGCLGCGAAGNVLLLICMRALSGLGGAGLMTMATIVNSDMIPFKNRGIYQAMQNGVMGFGMICGASFGGSIADSIGWRWCFLSQVPIAVMGLVLGVLYVPDPAGGLEHLPSTNGSLLSRVDVSGAFLLVIGISIQLVALSLGGNELPWSSPWVVGCLFGSTLILIVFAWVESKVAAIPIIPPRMVAGKFPFLIQTANNFQGLSAYAYLFMLPLYFQCVLLDSATTAGTRLIIPSLATPLGGLVAGIVMSRWGKLLSIVQIGLVCMVLGNALVTSFEMEEPVWKYLVYVFPANFGQGMVNPGTLFTSPAFFDHSDHAVSASTTYLLRSLGGVWGVAITSAIVQNTLNARLTKAFHDLPNKNALIDEIRHSVDAIRSLPPDIQLAARRAYHQGIQYSFATSTIFAGVAFILACLAQGRGLRNTHK